MKSLVTLNVPRQFTPGVLDSDDRSSQNCYSCYSCDVNRLLDMPRCSLSCQDCPSLATTYYTYTYLIIFAYPIRWCLNEPPHRWDLMLATVRREEKLEREIENSLTESNIPRHAATPPADQCAGHQTLGRTPAATLLLWVSLQKVWPIKLSISIV